MALYESADDIPADAVADHYKQAVGVYRELGTIEVGDETLDALLVPGTSSDGIRAWYNSTQDPDHVGEADGAGRPYIARADAEIVPEEVQEWDHPTVFSTINYQPINADEWTPYTWENGRNWTDGKPLPEYRDIRGLALFADVDFDADAKTRPVDDETRSLVEDALEHWVEAYASAVGDRDPVYVLDSVGGTYVMLAPRASYAILEWAHETVDADDRDRLIDELASRWRAYNADVQETVADELPALDGVFALDGNTNKNRLYKAPLALHKSLPGAVTPIDTEDIAFQFTPVEDIGEDTVETCREWASEYTTVAEDSEDLSAYAESLVETLFPDHYADVTNEHGQVASAWRWVLRQWLEDDRAARNAAVSTSLEDLDIDLDADELTLTADPDGPFTAAEALNVEQVAASLGIVSNSAQAERDDATRIEVNWRDSASGDSAIAREENFTDLSDNTGGGAAELVAWTLLESSTSKPTGWRRNGEHVSKVLDKLRGLGFNIPVYVPEKGEAYTADGETKRRSRTPNWALAKVARLLDLAPETAINDETGEITVPTLHNRVLAVLEHHDIEHGREWKDVHMDAAGNDIEAIDRDIEVAEYTPEDAHTDADDGDAEDLTPEGSDDESDSTESTWTARYNIHEREFIAGESSPYDVRLPGCEDLVWIEYEQFGQRTAGYAYREEDDEGNVSYDLVINADLELVSRLNYPDQDDRDEEWEIRINPTDPREPPKNIAVDPSAFNSPRDFREEIKGKSGSMRFDAKYGHQTVDALKTLVNAQDAPRRKAYSRIKLIHETVETPRLVTPEGTLGPGGWIKEPEHVWGDMGEGDVIDKWELSPDLDDYDTDTARDVAELLPQTRVHERFLPVLGYAFASIFRAPLTETSVTVVDKWNHIQGFGDTGAGKSSVGEKLWECMGMEGELIKSKKTPHSSLVTLSSTNAIPLFLDEYKPQEWRARHRDAFHEYMRDASTGSTTTKTYNYPTQKTYHLDTSVSLLGEGRFPSDANALARRTIETTMSQRATTPDTPMSKAFKELSVTLADDGEKGTLHHALAWWSYALGQVDDKLTLVEEWKDSREWALAEIERRGHDLGEVLDRDMYRQAIQTVTFGVRVWRDFAEEVLGADPEVLPSDEEIGDAIEYVTMRKNDENAINRSDRDTLFELAATAASKVNDEGQQQYLVEGNHYAFRHENTDSRPTELRIHLRSAVEELNRYVRDYNLDVDVASKNDYYSWIKEATDDPDSYALGVGKVTEGKRMVSVGWDALREEVDVMWSDFRPAEDPAAVNEFADGEDSESDPDGDGDDDGDGGSGALGATPIEDLEPGRYASVRAEVVFDTERSGVSDDEGMPILHATAMDDSGTAELVSWAESDSDDLASSLTPWPEIEKDEPVEVFIRRAKVDTYNGTPQLVLKKNVTEIIEDPGENLTIEKATEGAEPPRQPATDGGNTTVPEDAEGKLADARRLHSIVEKSAQPVPLGDLLAQATMHHDEMDPDTAESALSYAVSDAGILMETDDGYVPAN